MALGWAPVWRVLGAGARFEDARLATGLAGLKLKNPIGLAPGLDKSGEFLPSLSQLGFGYLVVGSITRQPREGNPKPRLARYPERFSLANCMGMPNQGLEAAVRMLANRRERSCPVIASVAGFSSEELLECAQALEPHVEAVEIGLVCPNTSESERMEEQRIFASLAESLAARRRKPVFIKLPPHHDDAQRRHVLTMVDLCCQFGLEGVSLNGSRRVSDPNLSMGGGSLAGRDTFADALRIVRDVAERSAGKLAIKASGGVFSGQHAAQMLAAGATTVEIYSAFIYRGWEVAGRINRELAGLLGPDGIQGLRRAASQAELQVAGVTPPNA
jgi:dihydroorotate dehydrogenase